MYVLCSKKSVTRNMQTSSANKRIIFPKMYIYLIHESRLYLQWNIIDRVFHSRTIFFYNPYWIKKCFCTHLHVKTFGLHEAKLVLGNAWWQSVLCGAHTWRQPGTQYITCTLVLHRHIYLRFQNIKVSSVRVRGVQYSSVILCVLLLLRVLCTLFAEGSLLLSGLKSSCTFTVRLVSNVLLNRKTVFGFVCSCLVAGSRCESFSQRLMCGQEQCLCVPMRNETEAKSELGAQTGLLRR